MHSHDVSLEERQAAVDAVTCPWCGASRTTYCRMPDGTHSLARTHIMRVRQRQSETEPEAEG